MYVTEWPVLLFSLNVTECPLSLQCVCNLVGYFTISVYVTEWHIPFLRIYVSWMACVPFHCGYAMMLFPFSCVCDRAPFSVYVTERPLSPLQCDVTELASHITLICMWLKGICSLNVYMWLSLLCPFQCLCDRVAYVPFSMCVCVFGLCLLQCVYVTVWPVCM